MRRLSSILIKQFHNLNKFSHRRSVDGSQPILPLKARGSKSIQTQEITSARFLYIIYHEKLSKPHAPEPGFSKDG